MKRICLTVCCLATLTPFVQTAYAFEAERAPVIDLAADPRNLAQTPAEVFMQRFTKLENQVKNLNAVHEQEKIEALQKEVQELRGKVEEQAHEIQQLQRQPHDENTSVREAKTMTDDSAAQAADRATYQNAITALTNQQYAKAINQFKSYLEDYPTGKFRDRAYFWLGKVYYLQGHIKRASWQFRRLAKEYPNSQKAPEALYRLGLIHMSLGNEQQGQDELRQVVKRFPKSRAAEQAKARLNKPRA